MTIRRSPPVVLVLLIGLILGCGSNSDTPASTTSSTATATVPATPIAPHPSRAAKSVSVPTERVARRPCRRFTQEVAHARYGAGLSQLAKQAATFERSRTRLANALLAASVDDADRAQICHLRSHAEG